MTRDSGDRTDEKDWTVPDDASKQVRITATSPDTEYPLAVQIAHKDDALAAKAGLTIEQAAVLQQQLSDLLDQLDDVPETRSRSVENDDTGKGFE